VQCDIERPRKQLVLPVNRPLGRAFV